MGMTDRESAAGLVELRRKLAGVSCHAFGGDNLAIFLASEFEPGVEDNEMDESETWKQGAIDLSNQVMDAIHAHYAAVFTSLLSELERVGKERDDFERYYEEEMIRRVENGIRATKAEALVAEAVRVLGGLGIKPPDGPLESILWGDMPEETLGTLSVQLKHLRAARAFIEKAKP